MAMGTAAVIGAKLKADMPGALHACDLLADHIVAKLIADPIISSAEWCGRSGGRPVAVFRVPDKRQPPASANYPCIVVAVDSWETSYRLAEQRAQRVSITVTLCMIEDRTQKGIPAGDLGPGSIAAYVVRILQSGTPTAATFGGLIRQPPQVEGAIENVPADQSQLEGGAQPRDRSEQVIHINLVADIKATNLDGVVTP
jgi:hypothetical protein